MKRQCDIVGRECDIPTAAGDRKAEGIVTNYVTHKGCFIWGQGGEAKETYV